MTLLPEESLRSLLAVEGLFHDIPALQKLFFYFRYEGLASIVLWMLALVLLMAYAVRWRRSLVCWSALSVAIGGFVLAKVNSHNVSAIKIDFSEQVEAAKVRAEQGRLGNLPHADADSKHSYRQDGEVQRTEGKQLEEKVPLDSPAADETAALSVRTMDMHEVAQANRLDRLNLFFARWTLYLAVGLAVIDYFRRFNTTFGCYLPLPLSGRLVDSLFPKSHTVCIGRRRRRWKRSLNRMVRKGETFVFFSRKDPWSKRRLRRLPWYLPLPWRIDKVACTNGDRHFDDEFLFELAWFGRYCFVVVGDEQRAVDLLDSMAGFLELRRATRASAQRTVNVVWDLETDVPDATLDRLLPLCRETNFRLIVALTTPPDAALAGRFQEACV
jgi:hypothetical protein